MIVRVFSRKDLWLPKLVLGDSLRLFGLVIRLVAKKEQQYWRRDSSN